MSNIATILIKPRSGMTTYALALASGLELSGLNVQVIVPEMRDIEAIQRHNTYPRKIMSADNIKSMTSFIPDVYVFDDAIRCAEVFRRHREGELLNIARERLSLRQDEITRIFLFQYSL